MGNLDFLTDNVGAYICLNNEIIEARRYADEVDDIGLWGGGIAYEVVRVIQGVPMFFEDHCARLNESLQKLNMEAGAGPGGGIGSGVGAGAGAGSGIGEDFSYGKETGAVTLAEVPPEASIYELLQPIVALLRANGVSDCNVKLWASHNDPGAQNTQNAQGVQNAQNAQNAPGVQNTQNAPGAQNVYNVHNMQNIQNVQNMQNVQSVPSTHGTYGAHGAHSAKNAHKKINLFCNINRSFYPPPEYYADGVPTGLYAYTRDNPNVKQVVSGFKEQVEALIQSGGVFELLLYDNTNSLTEGSRSNLFFSRGEQLFTAPDRAILKGTIRKYVFIAAQRAGIEIVERPVILEEIGLSPGSLDRRRAHGRAVANRFKPESPRGRLHKPRRTLTFPTPGPWPGSAPEPALPVLAVNGAFLTGTSIGVLPIARIGGVKLNSTSDHMIRRIMAEYDKIARDYINARL